MALPTVAFDTPVSREYLGPWGVYAPRGEAWGLAQALESLLADEKRAVALGQALRARAVAHYSCQEAGRRIMAIYEALT
jgi:glycosyltransferase involved in cell wall biosynthesis